MPVKGGYLLAAGGGVILVWSGIRGKKWTSVLRDVISGKRPQAETTAYAIQTAPGAFDSGESAVPAHGVTGALGASIVSDALQYQGAGYVWGGAPGSGAGHWDCSSFVNAVVGRDLGLAIPLNKPGSYRGQSHGPNTLVWLAWTGAFRIKRRDAAPGDLAIWQTHMGIITDNGKHCISAHDPQDGTTVTTIDGTAPRGEVLIVRRLKAVTPRVPGRANIRVKHG
jgi:cell wall-associated NlpC family hydrolase